jgi:hypothetical protein
MTHIGGYHSKHPTNPFSGRYHDTLSAIPSDKRFSDPRKALHLLGAATRGVSRLILPRARSHNDVDPVRSLIHSIAAWGKDRSRTNRAKSAKLLLQINQALDRRGTRFSSRDLLKLDVARALGTLGLAGRQRTVARASLMSMLKDKQTLNMGGAVLKAAQLSGSGQDRGLRRALGRFIARETARCRLSRDRNRDEGSRQYLAEYGQTLDKLKALGSQL